jgi:hypothetical protein
VLIKGRWYAVNDFVKRHPGGRILNFYRGKDASEAYTEFHVRSVKADKMLKSLKSRPDDGRNKVASEVDPLTTDFNELREQLKAEGFFDTSMTHVAYRLAEVVAMHAAGFWLIAQGWWVPSPPIAPNIFSLIYPPPLSAPPPRLSRWLALLPATVAVNPSVESVWPAAMLDASHSCPALMR